MLSTNVVIFTVDFVPNFDNVIEHVKRMNYKFHICNVHYTEAAQFIGSFAQMLYNKTGKHKSIRSFPMLVKVVNIVEVNDWYKLLPAVEQNFIEYVDNYLLLS